MALRYIEQAHLSPKAGVSAVAFSPNGTFLASGGLDGNTCIWRVDDYALLYMFSSKTGVVSLVWAGVDEKTVICGLRDGTVVSLTMTEADLTVTGFWAHSYPVDCLAFSQENLLATGGQEEVRVWRALQSGWTYEAELPMPPKTSFNRLLEILVTSIHWFTTQNGTTMLLVSYMNHGVHIFESDTWRLVRSVPIHGPIADTSLSEDGKLLAVSNVITGFDVYYTETGTTLCSFGHRVTELRKVPVLFCHNGLALLGGSPQGDVHLWDVGSGRKLHSLLHRGDSQVLALAAYYDSVNDTFLVATGILPGSIEGSLVVWKASDLRKAESMSRDHSGSLEDFGRAVASVRITMVTILALGSFMAWMFANL